jgi:hypothetical protein
VTTPRARYLRGELRPAPIRVLLLLLVLLAAPGCYSRAKAAAAQSAPVQIRLTVRNNLNIPLNLTVTQGNSAIWNGNIAANSSQDATVGPVLMGSQISLRAVTAQGAVVSARTNVRVSESAMIWTIP